MTIGSFKSYAKPAAPAFTALEDLCSSIDRLAGRRRDDNAPNARVESIGLESSEKPALRCNKD